MQNAASPVQLQYGVTPAYGHGHHTNGGVCQGQGTVTLAPARGDRHNKGEVEWGQRPADSPLPIYAGKGQYPVDYYCGDYYSTEPSHYCNFYTTHPPLHTPPLSQRGEIHSGGYPSTTPAYPFDQHQWPSPHAHPSHGGTHPQATFHTHSHSHSQTPQFLPPYRPIETHRRYPSDDRTSTSGPPFDDRGFNPHSQFHAEDPAQPPPPYLHQHASAVVDCATDDSNTTEDREVAGHDKIVRHDGSVCAGDGPYQPHGGIAWQSAPCRGLSGNRTEGLPSSSEEAKGNPQYQRRLSEIQGCSRRPPIIALRSETRPDGRCQLATPQASGSRGRRPLRNKPRNNPYRSQSRVGEETATTCDSRENPPQLRAGEFCDFENASENSLPAKRFDSEGERALDAKIALIREKNIAIEHRARLQKAEEEAHRMSSSTQSVVCNRRDSVSASRRTYGTERASKFKEYEKARFGRGQRHRQCEEKYRNGRAKGLEAANSRAPE